MSPFWIVLGADLAAEMITIAGFSHTYKDGLRAARDRLGPKIPVGCFGFHQSVDKVGRDIQEWLVGLGLSVEVAQAMIRDVGKCIEELLAARPGTENDERETMKER